MKIFVPNSYSATQPHSVSARCPNCGQNGTFDGYADARDIVWTDAENRNYIDYHRIGMRRCPNHECRSNLFICLTADDLVAAYPPEIIGFDATDLPPMIFASLKEAILCHGAGAYRASALMVRRVLEELCADRGAEGKDLKKRLEALKSGVVIPQELLEAADELRLLGNDAAHIEAKTYDSIGKHEASIAIELAKELLKAVYQYKSLVEKLRALKKP